MQGGSVGPRESSDGTRSWPSIGFTWGWGPVPPHYLWWQWWDGLTVIVMAVSILGMIFFEFFFFFLFVGG